MLLGARLAHGVRALYELAILPERRSAVRDLAKTCGTTEAVLRRILLELRAAGYLEAQKGRVGGFRLLKDAQEINIAEVARILEREPVLALGALRQDLLAVDPQCPTYPFWRSIEEKFLTDLAQATLADVIAWAGEAKGLAEVRRGRAKAKSRRRTTKAKKTRTRAKGRPRRSRRGSRKGAA